MFSLFDVLKMRVWKVVVLFSEIDRFLSVSVNSEAAMVTTAVIMMATTHGSTGDDVMK